MANIPVAPFYVPRPAGEQFWFPTPASAPRGLLEVQPTDPIKRITVWQFNNYDSSVWSGQPIGVPQAITYNLVPYEYGNQFSRHIDHSAFWLGEPIDVPQSLTLRLLPYQYGNQYFNYVDISPVWSRQPTGASQGLTSTQLYQYGNQFFKRIDYSAVWPGQPSNVPPTLKTTPYQYGNQYFSRVDDPAIWLGKPLYSASINLPFGGVDVFGTLELTESKDIALFNGFIAGVDAQFALVETADIVVFSGLTEQVSPTGDLIIIEPGDTAAFSGITEVPDLSDFRSWKFGRRFDRSLTKRFPWRN